VIVRWGLAELPGVLGQLSVSRPLLISTERRGTVHGGLLEQMW
jgi:hypothetical protein